MERSCSLQVAEEVRHLLQEGGLEPSKLRSRRSLRRNRDQSISRMGLGHRRQLLLRRPHRSPCRSFRQPCRIMTSEHRRLLLREAGRGRERQLPLERGPLLASRLLPCHGKVAQKTHPRCLLQQHLPRRDVGDHRKEPQRRRRLKRQWRFDQGPSRGLEASAWLLRPKPSSMSQSRKCGRFLLPRRPSEGDVHRRILLLCFRLTRRLCNMKRKRFKRCDVVGGRWLCKPVWRRTLQSSRVQRRRPNLEPPPLPRDRLSQKKRHRHRLRRSLGFVRWLSKARPSQGPLRNDRGDDQRAVSERRRETPCWRRNFVVSRTSTPDELFWFVQG